MNYKAILFDVDGTLTPFNSAEFNYGVREWFEQNSAKYKIALVTNQGGVGLHYWMKNGNWGEPDKYPDQGAVYTRLGIINNSLPNGRYLLYICFAYQAKNGNWAPIPAGNDLSDGWNRGFRKPAPGMLYLAMEDLCVMAQETLMVGDSEEDEEAARRANVDFMWAQEFFGDNNEQS